MKMFSFAAALVCFATALFVHSQTGNVVAAAAISGLGIVNLLFALFAYKG